MGTPTRCFWRFSVIAPLALGIFLGLEALKFLVNGIIDYGVGFGAIGVVCFLGSFSRYRALAKRTISGHQ